jgi:diaminohydroxyphosphoribosylaminopyrimidine deaminase/5-amino-6-(5-phosphoribosylamino)uracil reductase
VVFSSTETETSVRKLEEAGVQVVPLSGRDIAGVLGWLHDQGLQSVLVEGGTAVAGAFCDARLVDKITLIAAPIIVGGAAAPAAIGGHGAESLANALHLKDLTVERLGEDIAITGYPEPPVTK